MENRSFYMIYVEGGNAPAYKHETIESAKLEAQRLAEKTGKDVFILFATKKIKLNKFTEVELINPDIPF